MAALLLYGRAGLGEFTDEVVNRPEVQSMIERVHFGVNPVAVTVLPVGFMSVQWNGMVPAARGVSFAPTVYTTLKRPPLRFWKVDDTSTPFAVHAVVVEYVLYP